MTTAKDRPNILLFLTDDHGPWSLGCYGNSELPTPNFDRLAAEGVRFANAFTPCPVCSPARACVMTGRTPSQVGMHDWLREAEQEIAEYDWLADEVTLPELLHTAGYHTCLSGKWHIGRSHLTPRGFDRCFGLPGWQGAHESDYAYHLDGRLLTLKGNKSGHITDYALRFLDEAPDDRPIFLNVGYIATHSPYEAEAHDPAIVAEMENFDFRDIPPYHPHPWHKNEGLLLPSGPTPEDLRSRYMGYYAAVTEIDRNVGRIMDHLRDTGRLDNTIVMYVSDHGCALGHHGFWGKGNSTRPLNMHETSIRVPLIVRGPGGPGAEGIASGRVVEHCVDHYDTFQTLCEWAGVKLEDRDYPGKSYWALTEGTAKPQAADAGPQAADWDDTRYGEYGDLRMIRTPTHKFVKRYPHGPYDLFDLEKDPDETLNRAGWEDYLSIQHELEQRLETWYAAHENPAKSGLKVKELRRHNMAEAWRDGKRETRGLQVY